MESNRPNKTELLSMIKDEFWLSDPPSRPDDWENLTDNIKSKNYWEGIEETKPFWGKDWSKIELEDFEKCRGVFIFLPDAYLPYFAGAYMMASLLEGLDRYDLAELFFVRDPREMRPKVAKRTWALNRRKIAPFNARQRIAMAEYLSFLEVEHFDPDTAYFRGFLLGEIQEEV